MDFQLAQTQIIFDKLEAFIRKFYTNELLRGVIFFVGLGLLYFFFTLFVEYFLWLKPTLRTVLFWMFIIVEVFLLIRFIAFPLFKLFKLQRGIDFDQASVIIGNHFNEVGDKLTNFLQLSQDKHQSELLMASIAQKSNSLQPIPFNSAVNYASNRKYLPLAAIPLLLLAFFYISGNSKLLSQSLNRVVNHNEQFIPPAPFEFVVKNKSLVAQQNQDFKVNVETVGTVIPENMSIQLGDETYFMESEAPGKFSFKFDKPVVDINFNFAANKIQSKEYLLIVKPVPSIANISMRLDFPGYLSRKAETVNGTGNAQIPEGTRITWQINAVATDNVKLVLANEKTNFARDENKFNLSKSIRDNLEYQIITSNKSFVDYEKLAYQLTVVKDQFPTINAGFAPDTLKLGQNYVLGQVSDDHGLSRLQIVYYDRQNPKALTRGTIPVKNDLYDRFVFKFPSNLPVVEGITYEYYFEVFDNDAPHGYRSSKSTVFSSRISTDDELKQENLQQQNENISSMERSLKSQKKQLSDLDKIQQSGKEKESLEFKDQQKVADFIKKQKQQDELMKEFSKKLDDNLEKIKTDKKDELKEELQKRIEKSNEDLEKNKKLLDELKELNDKLKKEEFSEKLDKFKQTAKNQAKNLEQLVELTKKYYVQKKAEQIADKLDKLGDKQNKLAEKDSENSKEKQDEINKEFDDIQKELKDLEKQNEELKSPVEIPKDKEKEKSIDEDLKKASDELKKDNKAGAKPKQKRAGKQMKEMSQKMGESMEGGEMEQMEEDVKMLRQILDNLLAYSFSQEDLMGNFKRSQRSSPSFNKDLKLQQDLRLQFNHVDDSLFAMSLRNPKIAEDITTEIGNVHYNIDKALENLVEAELPKGISHQQYATSAANKLADMLSDILTNMQMSLSGSGSSGKPKPGQGQGGEMQLPDIIKKQEGLGQKMKDGMSKGDKPGQKPGEKGGEKPGGEKPGGQKPGGKGQDGKGSSGSGSGGDGDSDQQGQDGEGNAKAIMEIYKEQRQLRDALEKELNKNGLGGSGQNALDQMKQIEKQLLNKGFNNDVLQRALNLKYELLKLDKAVQQQGEEKRRQAETSKKQFENSASPLPAQLREYLNSIEILNRQSLPLRPVYNEKVQQYFKK